MAKDPVHECGSCGEEKTGYTRSELEEDGWVWHIVRGVCAFVMCEHCEEIYTRRRAEIEELEKKGR